MPHDHQSSVIKRLPDTINRVILPLEYSYVLTGDVTVTKTQKVNQYQQISKPLPNNHCSIASHSPIDGFVSNIGYYPSLQTPFTNIKQVFSIEIINDCEFVFNRPTNTLDIPPDFNITKTSLLNLMSQYGILGLGGAGFPSAKKLATQKIKTIIINAVECESPITVDNCLIINFSDQILTGIELLNRILCPDEIIIAIKESMHEACHHLQVSLTKLRPDQQHKIKILPIANQYPNGYSKTLIKLISQQDIAKHQHSSELGIVCLNVATIYSIKQVLVDRIPLIERLVTISGNIENTGTYSLPIGTPLLTILEGLRVNLDKIQSGEYNLTIRIGGDYMGYDILNTQHLNQSDKEEKLIPYLNNTAIDKTTQVISINYQPSRATDYLEREPLECIKCNYCDDKCPLNLSPQQLYWFSKNIHTDNNQDILKKYHITSCIECGICDAVCPSQIPLAAKFKHAKSIIKHNEKITSNAHVAKLRSEWRTQRIESTSNMQYQHADILIKSTKTQKQDLLSAALARAKNKKITLHHEIPK